jgi:hypothetical protein
MIWHALHARWSDVPVVLEESPSRLRLLRRRVQKLGLSVVAGQLAFRAALFPALAAASSRRRRNIVRDHMLDDSPFGGEVVRVPSVNDPETQAQLRRLDPAVVVVNGTRILGRETLTCVAAPFVNTHAGITPYYRGVHGGYWALADGSWTRASTRARCSRRPRSGRRRRTPSRRTRSSTRRTASRSSSRRWPRRSRGASPRARRSPRGARRGCGRTRPRGGTSGAASRAASGNGEARSGR